MKKVQYVILTAIAIYLLITIFTAIALYMPDLVRNKYLSISEQFPQNVTTIFTGIVGVATLCLAYIAYMSILESRRIRSEDIDQDHKRQTFREILDWAKRGIELFSEYQRGVANSSELKALETRLQTLWAEHLGIVRGAEALGDELLADDVKEAANKLEDYFFTIRGRPARSNPTPEECETEFTSLLGIASSRKAKLKL